MRDRKRVGSRQRSLSFLSFLPRRERPLLAGKGAAKPCGECELDFIAFSAFAYVIPTSGPNPIGTRNWLSGM